MPITLLLVMQAIGELIVPWVSVLSGEALGWDAGLFVVEELRVASP